MRENEVLDLTKAFAVRIVRLYQFLKKEHREFVMSTQLLKSGTSIGANVREAVYGQSRNDFIAKLSISLKEASETMFWLEILWETDYLTEEQFISIKEDCERIVRILTAIVKSSKNH